jgi:hypothetical protein
MALAFILMASLSFSASAQAQVDTRAPVLTSVNVSSAVNAGIAGQFVQVDLCVWDDLSGVAYFNVTLASPDGSQRVTQSRTIEVPRQSLCLNLMMGVPRLNNPGTTFNTNSQPGTWSVYFVQLTDMAGNVASFQPSQIAKLGHTTFVVTNSFYSTVLPVLHNGTISTPTVSLSTPPPYTPAGTLPLASMQIVASDAVTQPVEGIDEVSARFCLPPVVNAQCADGFILRGQYGSPVRTASTFSVSGQPISSATGGIARTGTYSLYSVSIQDMAGNVVLYQDKAFGGAYNLASYFGGNTIQLTQ